MIIELAFEKAFGEPGPNMCWFGEPREYLHLINRLHPLGTGTGLTITSDDLADIITLKDCDGFILKSSEKGTVLSKLSGRTILMELNPALWREILINPLIISFKPSFAYVEFDDLELTEEANIIMESLSCSAEEYFRRLES